MSIRRMVGLKGDLLFKSVVCVAEDLDMLLEFCDRIMVLCDGKVTGIVDARKTTKEEVGRLMTSHKEEQ